MSLPHTVSSIPPALSLRHSSRDPAFEDASLIPETVQSVRRSSTQGKGKKKKNGKRKSSEKQSASKEGKQEKSRKRKKRSKSMGKRKRVKEEPH
tara:strand:+ start:75 stop:356 length:282 start_codon:yes stop_codon:yes gene_type:complete